MRYDEERGTREEGGWMRGRGYVGQFSRNSMGRDRHSNPRYPRSTLSGSCLFKQASNSILGTTRIHSLSLSLLFALSFSSYPPSPISHSLVFPTSLSLFLVIRLSVGLAYRIRLSLPIPLFRGAPNANPRTVLRHFNSCDNYLDFSCTTSSDGSIVSL